MDTTVIFPASMPTSNKNSVGSSDTSSDNENPISFDLNKLADEYDSYSMPTQIEIQTQNDIITQDDQDMTENIHDGKEDSDNTDSVSSNLSARDEHVKMVLLSRRKENGTMKIRRDLLFAFVFSQNHTHMRSFFHSSMADNKSIINLHDKLMKCRVRQHDTTKQFLGESLFTLFKLLHESDTLKDEDPSTRNIRRGSEPVQIKNLRAFFLTITNRYDFDEVNASDKKQRNIVSQNKSGSLIQDEYAQNNPDWKQRILPSPCPLCNHNCLLPHECDSDILKEITILKDEFLVKQSNFTKLSPTEQAKTKKPKQPVYPKQHIICMCVINRCRDYTTGKGCINCESTVRCGMKLNYNPVNGHSNCKMCQCPCTAYFKRIEWSKLKAQVEVDKEKKAIELKETQMRKAAGTFVHFHLFDDCSNI